MIERSRRPATGRVADRAVVIEISGNVVRVCGAGVIRGVTIVARARGVAVISVGMALRAAHGGMRPGQREAGQVMIEGGGLPAVDRVASGAVMAELIVGVFRVRGLGVVRRVTGIAFRGGIPVAARMTSGTRR